MKNECEGLIYLLSNEAPNGGTDVGPYVEEGRSRGGPERCLFVGSEIRDQETHLDANTRVEKSKFPVLPSTTRCCWDIHGTHTWSFPSSALAARAFFSSSNEHRSSIFERRIW